MPEGAGESGEFGGELDGGGCATRGVRREGAGKEGLEGRREGKGERERGEGPRRDLVAPRDAWREGGDR